MNYKVMKNELNKILESKKKLNTLLNNKNNLIILNKWLRTELTYTSNGIEGNTLTKKETTLIIEENITSSSKPIKEYYEAINHSKAFDYILNVINNNIQIDEKVILNIHKIILTNIDNYNTGFYRNVSVRISGSQTILPNPLKVSELMSEFNNWLLDTKNNDYKDIILRAIESHYKLVSIHPFIDGNGRTARLLMNLILIKNGFTPIIIRKIDRKRYLSVIENRQLTEDKEKYYNFMLSCLNRSFKIILDLLDNNKKEVNKKDLLTISQFSKLVNLPISTIRYWVKIHKLKPISYTESGYMLFSKEQKSLINDL